jgi:amidohydrolase
LTTRWVQAALYERMVALRRDLHQHPELSFDEHHTMARVSKELTALGIEHRAGVGGTGIVADLGADLPGPRIALRADLDALPIQEETGLPYASRVPGVMHACGHDGHTSALVGAAALLAADPPPHPVRLVWQPGEEHGNGALRMIEAGVLEGVDLIFGGHLDRGYPPGTLVVTEGAVNASTDTFVLEILGRQGHGARPHETIDAVVVASLVVTALQTVVSRHVDPAQAAVVTVGRFEAGSAPNIIAGKATLEGTIRSQHPDVRRRLKESVEQVARSVGSLHGAAVSFTMLDGTPPLLNPPGATAIAREAALQVAAVERMRSANMGGEDFAWYLTQVPGCYIRFGCRTPGYNDPAHSGKFDFHESALAVAAAWFDRVARVAGEKLASGMWTA